MTDDSKYEEQLEILKRNLKMNYKICYESERIYTTICAAYLL